MAQRLNTSFVNTNIPGAYAETTVKSTPVGVTSTGDIVIIGEAAGGADYKQETLSENFFTATQLDRVAAKYLRGPIVDAMRALVSPSNDTNIQGSSGRVYIVKTNAGSKASATVAYALSGDYGVLQDSNFGVDGNKYKYQVTEVEDELVQRQGDALTITDGTAFDALSFTFRGNGDVETVITLSGISTDHDTITKLATEIDGQLPAGFSCEADTSNDSLIFKADDDIDAEAKGWGKSFELIDSTTGDLAKIGHVEELVVASQEPEVNVSISRNDINLSQSFDVLSEVALSIGYNGDTASVTITDSQLTTTVTGGTGADLSIDLSDFSTISDLADYIDSQVGYSASSVAASNNLSPVDLDDTTFAAASTIGGEPGRAKRALHNFKTQIGQSGVLEFVASATAGLPSGMAKEAFLTGGTKGATSGADIVDALPVVEGIKVNFVVPLFSRDASEDIADGLTDSGSTYTIDAINFAVKSHVLAMSTVKLKRNRIAMLSKWGSFNDIKEQAQNLASFRSVLSFQKTSQVNQFGEVQSYFPWHTAAIAAGMQSAGFYRSLTNKFANVISFTDPAGFDSGNIGDVETAIDAGTMFLQSESAGNKWVVDQTTYGFDTNFVYNSLQAVYMSDVLSVQLAESIERFVVGKSLADINSAAISGFIARQMEVFRRLKIIGASDDAPLGYKGLSISINGPIANVKLEAKLATAILFIPIQLELSAIQSSTSA